MFLVEKRSGEINARACANESMQQQYISKENAASPTLNIQSVFITAAIEAHKRRNVVKLDIPGAYLHTDTDKEVVILL